MNAIPEREFIRGNRDGPNRRNETYTICRVNVPQARFKAECQAGLHSTYLEHQVSGGWRCPAHARRNATTPASLVDYATKMPLLELPADGLEVVHLTQDQPAAKQATCVICRLRVPRDRLVEEVKSGLHPGFRTITRKGAVYVQGIRGARPDNVNYHSACDFCLFS